MSKKSLTFARCNGVAFASFFPFKLFESTERGDIEREKAIAQAYSNPTNLTTEERLNLMWGKDAHGNYSPELQECQIQTGVTFIISNIYGFMTRSMFVYHKFVKDNKHEMFKSPSHAQDAIRKDMMRHGALHGLKVGVKLSAMVLAYSVTTHSCNAIRNDVNPLDHAACGAALGSTYCFIRGPKAMVGGGAVGFVCGLLGGGLQKLAIVMSGETYSERIKSKFEENRKTIELQASQREKYRPLRDKWNSEESAEENGPSSTISLADKISSFIRRMVHGND